MLFLTKYSPELKAQIINERLTGVGTIELAEKYHIPARYIDKMVQRYRLRGWSVFRSRSHTKRTFTLEFKVTVLNYYQTHDESLAEVGAKFDLLDSQIATWQATFKRAGIEGLKPHRKGRPAKMPRKSKKYRSTPREKTELERLKAELAKKNEELKDVKMERDILKKSLALFGPLNPGKKLK